MYALTLILVLNRKPFKFLHDLPAMMVYHHTKFGYKTSSGLQDIVSTKSGQTDTVIPIYSSNLATGWEKLKKSVRPPPPPSTAPKKMQSAHPEAHQPHNAHSMSINYSRPKPRMPSIQKKTKTKLILTSETGQQLKTALTYNEY